MALPFHPKARKKSTRNQMCFVFTFLESRPKVDPNDCPKMWSLCKGLMNMGNYLVLGLPSKRSFVFAKVLFPWTREVNLELSLGSGGMGKRFISNACSISQRREGCAATDFTWSRHARHRGVAAFYDNPPFPLNVVFYYGQTLFLIEKAWFPCIQH